MVAVAMGLRAIPHSRFGDVDPVAVVIGLATLAVAVWTFWLAIAAQRHTETNTEAWAVRLADAVRVAEADELARLLGGTGQVHRAIDLRFTRRAVPAYEAAGERSEGRLLEVADYYRDLRPRRLVITGAPGAGKTVLAMHLALGLLAERDEDEKVRVPIRLSAAFWDTAVPLQEHLARHLVRTYEVPHHSAVALVRAGRILPIIDGLDEMDRETDPGFTSRASRALQAINAYQDGTDAADVVLTCRDGQYDALVDAEVWAHDAARVHIEPVDTGRAQTFLESRIGAHNLPRWQDVLDALDFHAGEPLARALANPWHLTLAAVVYQQRDSGTGAYLRDPSTLTGPDLDTPDKIRDHLLGSYIPAVTGFSRYEPRQVHSWLAVLARYLNGDADTRAFAGHEKPATDLALYTLWTLAGSRPWLLANAAASACFAALAVAGLAVSAGDDPSQRAVPAVAFALLAVLAWEPPKRRAVEIAEKRALVPRPTLLEYVQEQVHEGSVRPSAPGWRTHRRFVKDHVLPRLFELVGGGGVMFTGVVWRALRRLVPEPKARVRAVVDPREPIRGDFVVLRVLGAAVGIGLWTGTAVGIRNGPAPAVLYGLIAFAATLVAATGFAAALKTEPILYVMLLLCTRNRLPWRLGRFLHWCCTDAGLLRVAGATYQFRHRELQDYLSAYPTPSPDP